MQMIRSRSIALLGVALLIGSILFPASIGSSVLAATPADRSDVVLILDFSASILDDKANRDRFAAALDRIADRVVETSSDLVAGDATVSIVQFATEAADYPGCVDLKLTQSPETVTRLAECIRSLGTAYRRGLAPALTRKIGVDTNYVAALERAAVHLPADAVRPAVVLFTDGKHDVRGVPASRVLPARDRLFGSRTPFALLPVGMGLDSDERAALEAGLVNLRIIRDMPPCVPGAVFAWPQVVFESPDEAGNAVAVALQDVTCTFTVAPSPTPVPTPTPTPAPPVRVRSINLTAGDAAISIAWAAPASVTSPIEDYRVRCRVGEGEWTESAEGISLETSVTIEGLTNGAAYECEVAAVTGTGEPVWTRAPSRATPIGRPAPPAQPSVESLNQGVRVDVPPAVVAAPVSFLRYECSSDNGATWPVTIDVAAAAGTRADIGGLTNGVDYVCRAFIGNDAGMSDPSIVSAAVRPCGSALECNPLLIPLLGLIGLGLAAGVVVFLVASRTREYVVAVVDVVHTANLGHGSQLGIRFIRQVPGGRITGIAADRSQTADVRIRHRGGGRFEVTAGGERYTATSGESVVMTDSRGVRHEVILRAFNTRTAALASNKR